MPNTHFGEIGDVWKHLPLATLLSLEQPSEFWETHSGSPVYPLVNPKNTQNLQNEVFSRWWKIEFGVVHYFRNTIIQTADPSLHQSVYTTLLKKYANYDLTSQCPLTHTLGSSAIAVFSLHSPKKLIFCDIVLDDLISIRDYSKQWIPNFDNVVETHHGDGIDYIYEKVSTRNQKSNEPNRDIFLFIDPFQVTVKSEQHNLSSMDLFWITAESGFKTALWYGFETSDQRKKFHEEVTNHLNKQKSLAKLSILQTLWCGEIVFRNIDHMTMNPGISGGCGMLVANCSQSTLSICSTQGEALSSLYTNMTLPDKSNGAFDYREIVYCLSKRVSQHLTNFSTN